MNLVMIGHFKDAGEAAQAKAVIERLTEQVSKDVDEHLMEIGGRSDSFTKGMLDLLQKEKVYLLAPYEVEQLAYDVAIKSESNELVLTTDESDVSVFLKILIDKGAKVEVYSAHHHPETEYGR
jgi:hypothetical protein